MTELHLLILLTLAHLLADFYLQPRDWVDDRNRLHARSPKLRLHIAVHMALSLLVILCWQHSYGWSSQTLDALLLTFCIGASHYVIDVLKSYHAKSFWAFVFDQSAHLAVILLLWSWYCQEWQWLTDPLWLSPKLWLTLLIYLLLLNPASVLISLSLDRLCPMLSKGSGGLQAAGHAIGMLERLLIASLVLMNEFAAVGFLLAAKSVFRFGDLQNRQQLQLTEYILLGTLLSCSISLLGGWLLRQIWLAV